MALTSHAYRPLRGRHSILGVMGAWFVRELALHHLAFQLVLAALLIARGALASVLGQLGAMCLLLSWMSLVRLQAEAARAVVSVGEAFGDAQLHVPRQAPSYPRSHVWLPYLMWTRPGVTRVRHVRFAEVGGVALHADLFLPSHPKDRERRPAIVHVHGGSWVASYKEFQGLPLLTHLAANGWVAFNIDYRLSPHVAFPEHLYDVKRAIAWVREHADALGVDPAFIAVSGGSAGAHLASLAALTANLPQLQPAFEHKDTSVQAALSFYGVYDFCNRSGARSEHAMRRIEYVVMQVPRDGNEQRYRMASPLDWVSERAPPFYVVHGDCDSLTPVEDARLFVQSLRRRSRHPAVYVEVPGANHNFDLLPSPRTASIIEGAERFLTLMRRDAATHASRELETLHVAAALRGSR